MPRTVKLISLFLILAGLDGIWEIFVCLMYLFGVYKPEDIHIHVINNCMIGIFYYLPYLTGIFAGIGLLKCKEWARKLTIWIVPLLILFSSQYLSFVLIPIIDIVHKHGLFSGNLPLLIVFVPVIMAVLLIFFTQTSQLIS